MMGWLRTVAIVVVSLAPWVGSLYLHYWLEHGGIWEVDRPYRAIISLLLLALGMMASFLLYRALLPGRSAGP